MLSPPTAIFHQPTFNLFPTFSSRLKSLQPLSFPRISSSKSICSGGFVSKRLVLEGNRIWSPITMSDSVRVSSFRGSSSSSNGEEGVRVLEQEAFINGSSQFTADGLESTLNRMSKWLLAGIFSVVILWRHDAEALWAVMGSIVNAGLSIILKRILNQERPFSTSRSDPGMPSSHAQSIFYTTLFVILSMVQWRGVNEFTVIVGGLVLAFGSYLSWLRVSQKLHTASQVLVGATLGTIFSILWFSSWDALVLKAFVSYLWVRIFVVLGAVGFFLGFVVYVIRFWLMDER